jgi:aspartyl-tRNA(Asn)/glutamyl-tRNA(Gln) amidotransferase subunit B
LLVSPYVFPGSSAKILLGHLFDAPPSSSSRVTSLLTEHSLLSLPIETIDALCSNAIAANPKIADQLRQGRKPQLVMALVGKVMKETQGRADAKAVAKKLKAKLGLSDP